MTQKELRRLGRRDLLELLLKQTMYSEDLEKQLEELKEDLRKTREMLNDRTIRVEKAGSIAEASLQLNEVFRAAQDSADQYLATIKTQMADTEHQIAVREQQSVEKCENMINEATTKSDAIVADATVKSQEMIADAERKSVAYWTVARKNLDYYCEAHEGLREIMNIPIRMTVPDDSVDLQKPAETTAAQNDSQESEHNSKVMDFPGKKY